MKRLIIAAVLLWSAGTLRAQDMIFTLDYNLGKATNDMEKFIPDDAYRGGGLKYTKFFDNSPHWGIGVSIDWQGFYKKVQRESFPLYNPGTGQSNTDINAVQFRYMYMTPIYVSLNWYMLKDAFFLPYIGLNVGTIYTEQELYVSVYDNEINTAWDFGFAPEAGVHLAFGESGLGLNLIAKYNVSTYNYTFENIDFETAMGSHLSIGLGVSFMMINYY